MILLPYSRAFRDSIALVEFFDTSLLDIVITKTPGAHSGLSNSGWSGEWISFNFLQSDAQPVAPFGSLSMEFGNNDLERPVSNGRAFFNFLQSDEQQQAPSGAIAFNQTYKNQG